MTNSTTINTTNANKSGLKPQQQSGGFWLEGAALAHSLNLLHVAGHTVTTQTTGTEVTITIAGLTLAKDDRGLTQFVAVE